ncbi:hypothetical protein [Azospirillum agricola]|uniref:hypothetical protein n=1 Tax=Azospirillum agricola TaxID=1720247 RepID=UPI000A0F38B8|nr:hypothetical protein [Azospirillum agricola]SMH46198.1 hypothetical protein SAMN02982994_2354 [Azospirillum lipoferum]
MKGLDDFERMAMASLCPSGALVLPLLPPPDSLAESPIDTAEAGGLLPLGLGIVSVILLASLVALA